MNRRELLTKAILSPLIPLLPKAKPSSLCSQELLNQMYDNLMKDCGTVWENIESGRWSYVLPTGWTVARGERDPMHTDYFSIVFRAYAKSPDENVPPP